MNLTVCSKCGHHASGIVGWFKRVRCATESRDDVFDGAHPCPCRSKEHAARIVSEPIVVDL